MALPTGPIPLAAFDDIIEESWGDAVAQSLNNLNQNFDFAVWQPPSEITAPTGGTMATWFTVGGGSPANIFVPDWAAHAYVRVEINGVRDVTSGTNSYALQLELGPTAGRVIRQTGYVPQNWFLASWTDRIACDGIEGNRNVKINAQRLAGSAHWAVDADSDVAVWVQFVGGAIG